VKPTDPCADLPGDGGFSPTLRELAWFPRRVRASAEARDACEISAFGIHWAALDEDISVAALLAGRGDGTGVGGEAA
jgi:hypothetical protein